MATVFGRCCPRHGGGRRQNCALYRHEIHYPMIKDFHHRGLERFFVLVQKPVFNQSTRSVCGCNWVSWTPPSALMT